MFSTMETIFNDTSQPETNITKMDRDAFMKLVSEYMMHKIGKICFITCTGPLLAPGEESLRNLTKTPKIKTLERC